MKKAVILTGSKQYLVSEGETLDVDLIKNAKKTIDFEPLLLIDGEKIEIGEPKLSSSKVTAEVVTPGSSDREHSLKQLIDRVSDTITRQGVLE